MKYQDIINSLNTLASNEPNNKLHIKDVDKLLSFIGSNDQTNHSFSKMDYFNSYFYFLNSN